MNLARPKQKRVHVTFKDPDVPATKTYTLYGVSLGEAIEKTIGKKAASRLESTTATRLPVKTEPKPVPA